MCRINQPSARITGCTFSLVHTCLLQEVKDQDPDVKTEAIRKLIYLQMLGSVREGRKAEEPAGPRARGASRASKRSLFFCFSPTSFFVRHSHRSCPHGMLR